VNLLNVYFYQRTDRQLYVCVTISTGLVTVLHQTLSHRKTLTHLCAVTLSTHSLPWTQHNSCRLLTGWKLTGSLFTVFHPGVCSPSLKLECLETMCCKPIPKYCQKRFTHFLLRAITYEGMQIILGESIGVLSCGARLRRTILVPEIVTKLCSQCSVTMPFIAMLMMYYCC